MRDFAAEILGPHEEVGSNVSTMGIGIWSISEADSFGVIG
jgi:hypothetical protein